MINFKDFLTKGKFGLIEAGATSKNILDWLGEPQIFTPARKSYPTMIIYGDLEFRLRKDKLTVLTIVLNQEFPNFPNSIDLSTFLRKNKIEEVMEILETNNIQWQLDKVMTFKPQTVYITDKKVHLVFIDNMLVKLGAEYN